MARMDGAKPIGKWRYQQNLSVRERILARAAALLARTSKPLWYLETLVLSARFNQRLAMADFGSPASQKTRYSTRTQLWTRAVLPYLNTLNSPVAVLEFGVASGLATRTWLNSFDRFSCWHGFDTFEGLPEAWTRGGVPVMSEGVFSPVNSDAPFPVIDGYIQPTWHKGLIANTLRGFPRPEPDPLFVLIDVDLLDPTVDILDWIMVNGRPGDCIYFDEAFDPFNEGLAIKQASDRGMSFRVIGFTGSALAIVLE